MWIKRSAYERLQEEYDKLQINNLILRRRLTLSERKLEETEVKNGLEIVPELKRQISELKDQNKVMREMLKEAEENADDDCKECGFCYPVGCKCALVSQIKVSERDEQGIRHVTYGKG